VAKWQEIKITLKREAVEAAYAVLEQEGIANLAVEDSLLLAEAEREGWGDYFPPKTPAEEVTISFYLPEGDFTAKLARIKKRLAGLEKFGLDAGEIKITKDYIYEKDWAEAWKNYFHPLRIGSILVQPSWIPPEKVKPGDTIVHLDPGMAFGSGTHPSTAMCLEFLQGLDLKGKTVWDVGTGSGILAIAAEKLGARVKAVDIDPVAVRVALENRKLNGLTFRAKQGSLKDLRGSPHVIAANIVADVIGPMLPDAFEKLQAKGFFIAAGIIKARDGEMTALAARAGFQLIERRLMGEWVGYLFQKGEACG